MVISSLLRAMSRLPYDTSSVQIILPDIPFWRDFHIDREGWEILFEERDFRLIQRSITRIKECLLPPSWYHSFDRVLTLGDIPLRVKARQVVFVHQPLIVSPKVDRNSNKGRFKLIRFIFRLNNCWANSYVVQTGVMANNLIASYPNLESRIYIVPQPVPAWLSEISIISNSVQSQCFKLIFPAANYPHKNHDLVRRMALLYQGSHSIELSLTITEAEFHCEFGREWIKCIGRLNEDAMVKAYKKTDAVFFPSLQESYGLPLLEAMSMGLIVICSDLPYARWLCGDEAIYFNPISADSAWQAITRASQLHESGWRPNWKKALSKIPNNWDVVADHFWKLLYFND